MTLGKSVNLSGPLVTPCGSICLKPWCLDDKKTHTPKTLYFLSLCPFCHPAPPACLTSEQKYRLPTTLTQPFSVPRPAGHMI